MEYHILVLHTVLEYYMDKLLQVFNDTIERFDYIWRLVIDVI